MRQLALSVAFILLWAPARAQVASQPSLIHIDGGSGTVGSGVSATCVASPPPYCSDLSLANAGSNTIWVATVGGVAAAVNGAGSIPIAAGMTAYWPPGGCPRTAMNCIAAGGSSVLTVTYGVYAK